MSIEAVGSASNSAYIYEKKKEELEQQKSIDNMNKVDSATNSIEATEEITQSAKTPKYDQYIKGDAQKPTEVKPVENQAKTVQTVPAAKTTTETTGNTDAIDQEVEKLEKEKLQLQNKLQNASEEDRESIEQQINALENEITLKSSDSYKKQNATLS